MKRVIAFLTIAFALVATAATPAQAAYPRTPYQVHLVGWFGEAEGTLTWYNRSVGVQGWVSDAGKDHVTVKFVAYDGNRNEVDRQTRTVNDAVRSYNFAFGPSDLYGGVRSVTVELWKYRDSDNQPVTAAFETYYRP